MKSSKDFYNLDDGSVLTFERVERLDSDVYRPVLILGPLADPLVSKLNSESPDRYCRVASGKMWVLIYPVIIHNKQYFPAS